MKHKGLSLFIVPKPRGDGHAFAFTQDGGGSIEGRAIDTIGYRGMHSYEVNLDRWFVSDDLLVGGEAGIGASAPWRGRCSDAPLPTTNSPAWSWGGWPR